MKLTVVTPEKLVLDSVSVTEVLLPGERGEMGIMPGHAPLVSTLKSGVLKYTSLEGEENKMAVSWGYLEVQPDKVMVLAESTETKKRLDKDKALKKLKKILDQLKDPHISPEEIRKLRQEEEKQRSFLSLLK